MQSTPAHSVTGAARDERTREKATTKKLHPYFVAFTAVFGLLVLAGFSRTFFIPFVQGSYSRPLVVHIHGALFFGWTFLLFAQAWLAATRRLPLHRRIG